MGEFLEVVDQVIEVRHDVSLFSPEKTVTFRISCALLGAVVVPLLVSWCSPVGALTACAVATCHRSWRNLPSMTFSPVMLGIYALAAARITGLITTDTITEPLRDKILGWLDDRPATLGAFVAKLITCAWCAGLWVSGVTALLVWWHGDNPLLLLPALGLAIGQFVGMTSHVGR